MSLTGRDLSAWLDESATCWAESVSNGFIICMLPLQQPQFRENSSFRLKLADFAVSDMECRLFSKLIPSVYARGIYNRKVRYFNTDSRSEGYESSYDVHLLALELYE